MSITQRDSWDLKKRTGQLEVEVRGVPIKIAATMRLADEGKGSANTLSWNVSCGIPLIGGKLEKLLISDIQAKADADLAAAQDFGTGCDAARPDCKQGSGQIGTPARRDRGFQYVQFS